MPGLSRRLFIRNVAVLGAAAGVAPAAIAGAAGNLDVPLRGRGPRARSEGGGGDAAEAATTLASTIVRVDPNAKYSKLVRGPGEPFLVRGDLGVGPRDGRERRRRSLVYFGQLSDTHLIDTQSPARVEYTQAVRAEFGSLVTSACRPQDPLTVHALDDMVKALRDVPTSPVTGAPMAFTIVTGDLVDSRNQLEMRWFVDTMDGAPVVANSGLFDQYQGVQAWPEVTYNWHPDDPSLDEFGRDHDFPAYPNLLGASAYPIATWGSATPWYGVAGNHDTIFMGVFYGHPDWLEQLDRAGAKISLINKVAFGLVYTLLTPSVTAQATLENVVYPELVPGYGIEAVAVDSRRNQMTTADLLGEMFASPEYPGPVGHGFTADNLANDTQYWARDMGPAVRMISLDTNNHCSGADGSIPDSQWQWLERELQSVSSRWFDTSGQVVTSNAVDKLIVVASHHTSWTMDNVVQDPLLPEQVLHTGAEFVALLLRYPNVVLWINGHTHANTIKPHANPGVSGTGFWEVNTPSCIDWAQQGRLLDLVDNGDGTLSIFTVSLDHAADPGTEGVGYPKHRLASISRELSANVWYMPNAEYYGKPEDRNCELVVTAPFDLSTIEDAKLESAELSAAATRLAVAAHR